MHAEMGTMDVFLERLEMEKEKTDEQFIADNLERVNHLGSKQERPDRCSQEESSGVATTP